MGKFPERANRPLITSCAVRLRPPIKRAPSSIERRVDEDEQTNESYVHTREKWKSRGIGALQSRETC